MPTDPGPGLTSVGRPSFAGAGSSRRLLAGALALTLVAGAGTACTAGRPLRPEAARSDAGQILVATSFALTHLGARRGLLIADTALVDHSGLDADLRRVRLTTFLGEGQPGAVLVAPRARLRIGSDSLELSGGVVATTAAGDTLRTPRLVFDKGAMRLTTDTSFALHDQAGDRAGTGLATDLGLRPVSAGGSR